jgi:hypothetical protein
LEYRRPWLLNQPSWIPSRGDQNRESRESREGGRGRGRGRGFCIWLVSSCPGVNMASGPVCRIVARRVVCLSCPLSPQLGNLPVFVPRCAFAVGTMSCHAGNIPFHPPPNKPHRSHSKFQPMAFSRMFSTLSPGPAPDRLSSILGETKTNQIDHHRGRLLLNETELCSNKPFCSIHAVVLDTLSMKVEAKR